MKTKKVQVKVEEAFELEPAVNKLFVCSDGESYTRRDDAVTHAGFCDTNEVWEVERGKLEEAVLIFGESPVDTEAEEEEAKLKAEEEAKAQAKAEKDAKAKAAKEAKAKAEEEAKLKAEEEANAKAEEEANAKAEEEANAKVEEEANAKPSKPKK